jgi:hypothetical protein
MKMFNYLVGQTFEDREEWTIITIAIKGTTKNDCRAREILLHEKRIDPTSRIRFLC